MKNITITLAEEVATWARIEAAPVKRMRTRGWLEPLAARQLAVISPQVLNEFAHNILRKFPDIRIEELQEDLEAMIPLCTAGVTSTERSRQQRLGNMRIVNPFLVDPGHYLEKN